MWQIELADSLSRTDPGNRPEIIEQYVKMTGKTPTHLYRVARKHGFATGRTPRKDRGIRRSGITDKQVKFVAGLVHTTSREVKGPIMPVERALEIAVDSGYIEAGQISPAGMRGILRQEKVNPASLKAADPHTRMRSLHPNHTHVFDVSVCIQYYLKGKKGLQIMDERDFYKNKLHNFAKIKTRLLRYVIVDHFSGMFYFRYFDTTGETQNNLYEFLIEAWHGRDDDRFPFRGVPFNVLMDSGAANGSHAVVSFLSRLDVNVPEGRPYNSARQGSVEVTHNYIERWFESGLRLQPAHELETLNAWALDSCINLNANRVHTRHGMPRTQCWLMIKQEQLRELPAPEILSELYSYTDENFTRTVNRDYTISYKGEIYNLKHVPGVVPGASQVRIIIKPYEPGKICAVYNETVYEVEPVRTLPYAGGVFLENAAIIGQEYRSKPESVVQQAKKEIENMAYGEDRQKDQVPFAGLRVFGHQAEKVDLTYIARKGTPMEIDRAVVDKQISFTEFLKRLIARVGAITPDLNARLRTEFGGSIEISRAEEVIREIEADGRWGDAPNTAQSANQ
jgi:hypothetical protein